MSDESLGAVQITDGKLYAAGGVYSLGDVKSVQTEVRNAGGTKFFMWGVVLLCVGAVTFTFGGFMPAIGALWMLFIHQFRREFRVIIGTSSGSVVANQATAWIINSERSEILEKKMKEVAATITAAMP